MKKCYCVIIDEKKIELNSIILQNRLSFSKEEMEKWLIEDNPDSKIKCFLTEEQAKQYLATHLEHKKM